MKFSFAVQKKNYLNYFSVILLKAKTVCIIMKMQKYKFGSNFDFCFLKQSCDHERQVKFSFAVQNDCVNCFCFISSKAKTVWEIIKRRKSNLDLMLTIFFLIKRFALKDQSMFNVRSSQTFGPYWFSVTRWHWQTSLLN